MSNIHPLTFGSLFAGIGGFDLGLERAGLHCEWQVEIDGYCRRVLAKHWPKVHRHDDVRTFPGVCNIAHLNDRCRDCGLRLRDRRPTEPCRRWRVDVICGGPPCQRTSVAAAIQGKRTGETLWPEMLRVVKAIGPRFVIIEQPGGNKAWETQVASDLAGAGYEATRLQRSARGSGAPHRRRRVLFVAHAVRQRCEALAWQPESSEAGTLAWPAPPRGAWRTSGSGDRGMDDGFSDWMDRLKGLGNAVVPDIAEGIGRRLMDAYTQEVKDRVVQNQILAYQDGSCIPPGAM